MIASIAFFVTLLALVSSEKCLPNQRKEIRLGALTHNHIAIFTTDDVLNQIESRIFAIYLHEVLGYYNVTLHPIILSPNLTETNIMYYLLEQIDRSRIPALSVGVWMPSDYHVLPPGIEMAGRSSQGRFGWFIPRRFRDGLPKVIPYTLFRDQSTPEFKRFVIDKTALDNFMVSNNTNSDGNSDAEYIPEQCKNEVCVTLLAAHRQSTKFVIQHIEELKLFVKVRWLGDNLLRATDRFHSENRKFIVLHYTPSTVIDTIIEYDTITMPPCDEMARETLCKYETMPVLKYNSKALNYKDAPILNAALNAFDFDRAEEQIMLRKFISLEENSPSPSTSAKRLTSHYDRIACEWMNQSRPKWYKWSSHEKETIFIGGILPSDERERFALEAATNMAEQAINDNRNILPDVNLHMIKMNGGCNSETVMRTFLNYYLRPVRVLGVLGPPCSEDVEPIAGLSKIGMAVISYSVEGVTFADREKYQNFFRTIGDNRQYEEVYVQLFRKMNWHRVVAFTEDGQKYTEYLSQMEPVLKENGIELTNKKFSKYFNVDKMRSYLQDLINKKSNIIIADIYNEQALTVLCEAYKLKMTAKNGYVWFLPIWLQKDWSSNATSVNISCTRDEINEMLQGHFSLSHEQFARDDSIMQENRTVSEWKKLYQQMPHADLSNYYVGFIYDAMWTFAHALETLIDETPQYLIDLHSPNSTKRLIDIISNTSFDGVSGRIEFDDSGTRYTNISVMQWINGTHRRIGTFMPNLTEMTSSRKTRSILGGNLEFDETEIFWPSGKKPTDGTQTCSVQALARVLNIDCTSALYLVTTMICLIFVALISAASFVFWKRRYDHKLKESAKVMRNFGIDLLSLSSMPANTLDKWEVTKDRVVINRRLGEGAFGTVYGGEAQIDGNGWTAVAVKTLKKGSGTEDRLDFLSEAEAMKRFDHPNIIKLLGVCLQSEPIYTIMEFMLYGDLKTFLLARRHLVNEKLPEDADISPKRLTMMALDVARALSYLAGMKYVHRDVACRNCLVNAQRVVKLGDFGMARRTYDSDYYRFSRKGLLPVRWMAPESLTLGIFTPASDVWSFGILLYEIITFGSFPFQGLTNIQVLEHLKNGNTLAIPNGIKPQLEGLMNACWNLSYKKRPSACEVADFISNYPKLVTPSLDVPLASVQMPEADSDDIDLIPGLRRLSVQATNIERNDALKNDCTLPNGITLTDFQLPNDDDYAPSRCRNTSNTYNPIEPLLQYDGEMANSNGNLSLRRYVPMCGFKKNDGKTIREANSPL